MSRKPKSHNTLGSRLSKSLRTRKKDLRQQLDEALKAQGELHREWRNCESRVHAAEQDMREAKIEAIEQRRANDTLRAENLEIRDAWAKDMARLWGRIISIKRLLRSSVAAYNAQYGKRSLAEQNPELSEGAVERVEAVVNAARRVLETEDEDE